MWGTIGEIAPMTFAFYVLAMAGPFVLPGSPSAIPQPPVTARSKPAAARRAAPALPKPKTDLQRCLEKARSAPASAITEARAWLAKSEATSGGEPQFCLGTAYAELSRWPEAEAAFIAGRDAVGAENMGLRAKMGGIAGNVALLQNAPARALVALDLAHADAVTAGDIALSGEIALDRARALVALKRDAEASTALINARTSSATNPLAWLLSATLSRRLGKLAAAQAQITTAAGLAPDDPEVGLEAGLIAVLQGRDDAARKSWESVIRLAPGSETATTAQGYIAQLGAKPPVTR
jgi:tetratricopeptide (TPR) repeat protein